MEESSDLPIRNPDFLLKNVDFKFKKTKAGLTELAGLAYGLLKKWEPDRFAALAERAPAAPAAKLVYVAADGAGGSGDGKTAEAAREQEARLQQRRDGLRDFLLDVRWRRRHRRDQRRWRKVRPQFLN